MGISFEGEDSRGDHGLGRLVEFRFKAPPGSTSSSITTHTSSGQRNCAPWASQPEKSVTLLPRLGGRTTKSTEGHVVALEEKKIVYNFTFMFLYQALWLPSWAETCSFLIGYSFMINTGCPRRNVPDFGRVFLMLKYTDITQNTYIQS